MNDDAPAAGPVSTTGAATAPDGTALGYRTPGSAPAERFTVHLAAANDGRPDLVARTLAAFFADGIPA
ncbi:MULTISPECIES: hypothetical protein [unclassified Nocardiopsis]|uniref:hypothetical protein n=1 Tax=Nocardiopsis TaxID=2013 RepID=UPI00387B9DAF